jgi:hypothetical protein
MRFGNTQVSYQVFADEGLTGARYPAKFSKSPSHVLRTKTIEGWNNFRIGCHRSFSPHQIESKALRDWLDWR